MAKTIDVPELAHDAMMLAKYGHKVHPMGRLERRIVAALCAHLAERGWTPCLLDDGDTKTPVHDAKSAMELIFNLDDSFLYFCNASGRKHWVRFIGGNGIDFISDYSYNEMSGFDAAMEAFDPEEYA